MPATVDRGSLASYARFPAELDRDWLGRVCHLSEADLAVIRRRTDPVTQLGYAAQLVTVRAIGTFQSDPAAVPEPVAAAIARQLGIDEPGALAAYRAMPARWRHAAEIRDRCGYRDFATQPVQRGPSPSSLARALAGLGRVIKHCTCSDTATIRPTAARSTTCSAAVNDATHSPAPSSTASAASSGGTTRSGRKISSTVSAS